MNIYKNLVTIINVCRFHFIINITFIELLKNSSILSIFNVYTNEGGYHMDDLIKITLAIIALIIICFLIDLYSNKKKFKIKKREIINSYGK